MSLVFTDPANHKKAAALAHAIVGALAMVGGFMLDCIFNEPGRQIEIARAIAAARAEERERCAKIADSHAETSRRDARTKRDVYGANPATSMAAAHAAEYIAFKIRSGEP